MKKRKQNKIIITLIIIFISFLYGIYNDKIQGTFGLEFTDETNIQSGNNIKVYYLDVGQADSILIETNQEFMLIDAGNNNDGKLLVDYFKELGIQNFKYIVGTHPHEDHIGGLDDIINNFQINTIYLPDAITTTTTFMDVLDAIENKNLTYKVPKIDETFQLGKAEFKVIYTGTDTNDLNNTSIVLKMNFGNTSFLFTGDITSKIEKEILKKDIDVDVLKVGHHGSKYSSSEQFLDKTNPTYAIISVGKNNNYGHPAETPLENLKKRKIEIYRTDELGTILLTSNGKTIQIDNFSTNTNGG